MNMRAVAICLVMMLALLPVRAAMAQTAMEALKTSVDEVLRVLSSTKPGESGRVEKLYAASSKVFDPEELAKRTLGANWEAFSPEERSRFTKAFVKLLERTYLKRIEAYTDERVLFLSESPLGDARSEVSTKIVTSSKEVPIIYRLIRKNEWKVYDVVIEGVSLVQNYRNQFNQILARETPAQLLSRVENMGSGS